MANATEKQVNYILSLQERLGMSPRYVNVKAILGKNPIGFSLTRAMASRFISILEGRLDDKDR